MQLDVISLNDLRYAKNKAAINQLIDALLLKGIVGIKDIPQFEDKSRAFIRSARQFALLHDSIKQKYAPNRDEGETEGYELGVERFLNKENEWQIDDQKASYYAIVPNHIKNKWPKEVDLEMPYLELGTLIFKVGILILNKINLDNNKGITYEQLIGYGRMLHYHQENNLSDENLNWCGAHFDHGIFTGLMPAYYFQEGLEIEEPEEAGLYVAPPHQEKFEKILNKEKNILLFQVGEFGQLVSNDRVKATRHKVQKAKGKVERFSFALFYSAQDNIRIKSKSCLIHDDRYAKNQAADGSISYGEWHLASLDRYRVPI